MNRGRDTDGYEPVTARLHYQDEDAYLSLPVWYDARWRHGVSA